MAEDVLRLAGFTENVNYRKQAQLGGADAGVTGRPDFTFDLPKGHVLHMDVKFPLSSYLRYLEARTDVERAEHLKTFLRDVRTRVRELSKRNYSDGGKPRSTTSCCSCPTSSSPGSSTSTTPRCSTTRSASGS